MVSEEVVKKVAKLARLSLTDQEVAKYAADLKDILKAFAKLQQADTTKTAPAYHPIELKDAFRKDEVEQSLSQEQALANTTHKEKGHFKGPKVQ